MAVTVQSVIKKLIKDVHKTYAEGLKPFKASGKTIKSLRDETTTKGKDTAGTLYGGESIYYLKHGRAPGLMPPVSSILEWVRSKRLARGKGKNENSMAWGIAKSIAMNGTRIYRGEVEGLDVDEQVEKLQKKAFEDLNGLIKKQISASLKIALIFLFVSCSSVKSMTPIQKEQKKFERLKVTQKEKFVYVASFFLSMGIFSFFIEE